jgi:hypothetical protein
MFYSFILISTVSVLAGVSLVERINMNSISDYTFEEKTIEYAGRLFMSSVFIIPISHWPETGKKMKFITRWTQLQVCDALYEVHCHRHKGKYCYDLLDIKFS